MLVKDTCFKYCNVLDRSDRSRPQREDQTNVIIDEDDEIMEIHVTGDDDDNDGGGGGKFLSRQIRE